MGDGGAGGEWGDVAAFDLVEAGFAADAAGAGDVEVAVEEGGVEGDVGAEIDGDLVVLLIAGTRFIIDAVAEAVDVVARGDEAFGVEEASGEFEVVAGGAHGDGDGAGCAVVTEADFERFFGGEDVFLEFGASGFDDADAGAGLAATSTFHGCVSYQSAARVVATRSMRTRAL